MDAVELEAHRALVRPIPLGTGLTCEELLRLVQLRRRWPRERLLNEAHGLNQRRLEFAKWLVDQGVVTDAMDEAVAESESATAGAETGSTPSGTAVVETSADPLAQRVPDAAPAANAAVRTGQ